MLIECTIMTVDKNYPALIESDAIDVMVRMPKYTYIEMHSGSKYKVMETIKELQKLIANPVKKEPAKKETKKEKKTAV